MTGEPGTPAALWARLYGVALRIFRRLPAPVRRGLVRVATPSYTVGAVCALECEGRLLVLRQPHRPGWSLPGGLLGRGETASAAVRREVREETGLDVEVGLPVVTVVAAAVRRVDVVFRVRVPERFPVRPGGEARRATWLPLEEITDVDGPTRDILAALRRVAEPGAHDGRVLSRG